MSNTRLLIALGILLSLAVGFILGGGPSALLDRGDNSGSLDIAAAPTVASLLTTQAQPSTIAPSQTPSPTGTPVAEPTAAATQTPRPTHTRTATSEPTSTIEPTITAPPSPTEELSIVVTIPDRINLRAAPAFDAPILRTTIATESGTASRRSADSLWVQVQIGAEEVWVAVEVVEVSGDVNSLPVSE